MWHIIGSIFDKERLNDYTRKHIVSYKSGESIYALLNFENGNMQYKNRVWVEQNKSHIFNPDAINYDIAVDRYGTDEYLNKFFTVNTGFSSKEYSVRNFSFYYDGGNLYLNTGGKTYCVDDVKVFAGILDIAEERVLIGDVNTPIEVCCDIVRPQFGGYTIETLSEEDTKAFKRRMLLS